MLSIVVACSLENGIGFEGKLPWYLPADLKHFRQLTLNHAVIVGSKTFETDLKSKPLPGRVTIVLSCRKQQSRPEENLYFIQQRTVEFIRASINGILAGHPDINSTEIMVIGGEKIYQYFLPHVDRLYLTMVDHPGPFDKWFPPFDRDFKRVAHEPIQVQNDIYYSFETYERRSCYEIVDSITVCDRNIVC
ncbi:dihydrofolate reductase [Chroococcidiopsis sp.]|uniref:dihydrofolate reductase n=1 Tax=Chroococcidiopsis sp. TaxID=3088168 RepID=UPI003F2CD560